MYRTVDMIGKENWMFIETKNGVIRKGGDANGILYNSESRFLGIQKMKKR